MQEISAKLIENAIFQMCKEANVALPQEVYDKICSAAEFDEQNKFILKNAQIAFEKQRPLCQGTGQVIVFANIGNNVKIIDGNLKNAINTAVARCYKENYFRKSVVKDAILDRTNTETNAPAVIHIDFIEGDFIELKIIIKGGGSENVTGVRLLNPTSTEEKVFNSVLEIVRNAGKNACPPLFIGLGYGQTLENAVLLSKKAIFEGKNNNEMEKFLNENIEIGLKKPVLNVKELSAPTHIASLPLGVTIMCHSNRYHSCKIYNDKIVYTTKLAKPENIDADFAGIRLNVEDIQAQKKLVKGQKLLLSGKIYTARDQAQKKLQKSIKDYQNIPLLGQNLTIFYAGPCPSAPNEVCGPIGPTTSKRMDDFAIDLYENGVFATIGKGTRGEKILKYLKNSNKKYYELQGGIASYIANCVKSCKIVAFEELGPEAIYELEVENLPVVCVE